MSGIERVKALAYANGWSTIQDQRDTQTTFYKWISKPSVGGVIIRHDVVVCFDAQGRITSVSEWLNHRVLVFSGDGVRAKTETVLTDTWRGVIPEHDDPVRTT